MPFVKGNHYSPRDPNRVATPRSENPSFSAVEVQRPDPQRVQRLELSKSGGYSFGGSAWDSSGIKDAMAIDDSWALSGVTDPWDSLGLQAGANPRNPWAS